MLFIFWLKTCKKCHNSALVFLYLTFHSSVYGSALKVAYHMECVSPPGGVKRQQR